MIDHASEMWTTHLVEKDDHSTQLHGMSSNHAYCRMRSIVNIIHSCMKAHRRLQYDELVCL